MSGGAATVAQGPRSSEARRQREPALDIRKAIIKAYRRASGRPLTRDEIEASVSERGSVNVQRLDVAIQSLVRGGRLRETTPGTFSLVRERNVTVGVLDMTRNGYGFVETPDGSIYVAGRDIGGAMHGDLVGVRLNQRRGGDRGLSGAVAEIVERRFHELVGRFEKLGKGGIVVPSDRRVRGDLFVDATATMDASAGDMVVARITRFASERSSMQGRVTEILGPEHAPGVDVDVIIRLHGLRTVFPADALAAADAVPQAARDETGWGESRRDLRDLYTVTIDPVDARDFDDAVSVERREGGFRMWVHIADVSHYVPWGSAIDVEALKRATSVYLVDRVLPMLPERLSNGICSLNPGVDRLTMTVEVDLDRTGLPQGATFYDSVIRSDRRLDYGQVDRWLAGEEPWPSGAPDDETLRGMVTDFESLARKLGERRTARGGLDFETVEAKVLLNGEGHPTDVVLRERTVATNMIEESAIVANEAVARHMARGESPMVYRIHENPDDDALAGVAAILAEFDYPIKDIKGATPETFQRIVRFARGRPERLLINSLLLRSLKRARYVDYLGPHFGLASDAYTHFTSPIRRYPDLAVHRLLKARLAGTLDPDSGPLAGMIGELGWIADHSSSMEREAEWAEDDTTKLKLVELMADHLGEEFDGVITGVASFGMFVQLPNTAEGLVHVSAMTDDYFRYDAERHLLWGERRGATHRLGDAVRVRILEAIPGDLRIDMELA
jgi:ribonuclease R